jgi:hypothetical protein
LRRPVHQHERLTFDTAILVAAVEAARAAEKEVSDQRIEELSASLRREQMQCSVVEGALETARKDFARLMREAMPATRVGRP